MGDGGWDADVVDPPTEPQGLQGRSLSDVERQEILRAESQRQPSTSVLGNIREDVGRPLDPPIIEHPAG